MSKNLNPNLINTVDDLHYYLLQALKLEHSTIPPYITALYSLKPGANPEAFHVIRVVAVEEMLHLTLVANVLNAVGGTLKGTLTDPDFVPQYPTYLPTGETDFQVGLEKFSHDSVRAFLNIERGLEEDDHNQEKPVIVTRDEKRKSHKRQFLKVRNQPSYSFYSIGQFYGMIIQGMFDLQRKLGDALFCGDPQRQVTPEYYYNGAGDIVPVTDLTSAIQALRVIQEQGEGSRVGAIYDAERQLAHYYRFEQLELGQSYVINTSDPELSDKPHHPTGEKFTVDWDAVYPVKPNAKLSDYPKGSELYEAAKDFRREYSEFLSKIEYSFDGHPEALIPAVGGMFRLKDKANLLMRNPIPGLEGVNAAPIFRVD